MLLNRLRRASSFISTAKRGFYFTLEQKDRNVDFPFNVGYNDHFQQFSQYLPVSIALTIRSV